MVVDLPFVPVIADDRAFQEAVGDLDLGQDRDAPLPGGRELRAAAGRRGWG